MKYKITYTNYSMLYKYVHTEAFSSCPLKESVKLRFQSLYMTIHNS